MEQIIILDGNVVGLVSDSGAARWEFDCRENANNSLNLYNSNYPTEINSLSYFK